MSLKIMVKGDKSLSSVRGTGGRVDEMVIALLDSAFDKDSNVREIIGNSLFELGRKHPALVLSSSNCYLMKQSKLSNGHRVVILSAMEQIIKRTIDSIDQQLAADIIKQSSAELTQSKEVFPEWQSAASEVLVAISSKYCNDVMTELLEKFQPGVLPHFFVVQTLANMATANVYGMVPFVKLLLGTMLPMLGMAKQDNMKWVFATATSKFCEAIVEYVANINTAPDVSIQMEFFSGEIFSAWDVFFNVWLNSKEAKLRIAIIDALGHMSYVLLPSKLQECLPRLVPAILAIYKKHQDQPCVVTQGFFMILDASSQCDQPILEPFLDTILNMLFAQILLPIDYRVPASIKNHNELLRCFAVLAKQFSNRVIPFVLQKLEANNNEKFRIAALAIVRHLVNAAGPAVEDKKDLLLSGLKQVLPDINNKVKKMLSQTIIAMAHHDYLELEGGQLMIEFIVRQCALSTDVQKKPPTDVDYVSNDALRAMCENVLQLLSTTVENMDDVLWPYLLEVIVVSEYSNAIGIVCRSLHNVITRKRNRGETDYSIDFSAQVNLPKPPEVFARLVVLTGYPMNYHGCGQHVLCAMQSLAPIIHPELQAMWDTVLPKLSTHLDDHSQASQDWSQKSWEDLILKVLQFATQPEPNRIHIILEAKPTLNQILEKPTANSLNNFPELLSKSLDLIKDETFFTACGDAFIKHIPLYTGVANMKNFLFKCIGALMRKSTKKELINKLLDAVFANVKHSDPVEREGCAMMAGFAAASHLDIVLSKLDYVGKMDSKRSSSFLDFFKDASGDSDEKLKATLMLSYGYVTLCAPVELILSRLEASVLSSVVPQLTSVKDRVIKQNLIRSVEMIGQAMHPSHLKTNFNFTHRNSLLQHLKLYVKSESTISLSTETRALALTACTTMIKLDPKLSNGDLQDLMKTSMASVISCTLEDNASTELTELLDRSLSALSDLLLEVVAKDTTVATFELILQLLHMYVKSTQDYERHRSLVLISNLLEVFLKNVTQLSSQTDRWELTGRLLAWLIPRCMDSKLQTRMIAYDCVILVIRIILRLEAKDNSFIEKVVASLSSIKDNANGDVHSTPNVSNSAVDLAKVVSERLRSEQLFTFLMTLHDSLLESNTDCVLVVIMVLKEVVKKRGSECHAQVIEILTDLNEKLSEMPIDSRQSKYCGEIVCEFARHHLLRVITYYLDKPLPWTNHQVLVWLSLGEKEWLAGPILDQLLDMLVRCQPYEELSDIDSKTKKHYRRAFSTPLAVCCGISELSKDNAGALAVKNDFARVIANVLTITASMINTKPPKYTEKQSDEMKDSNRLKTMFMSSEMKVSPTNICLDTLLFSSGASGSQDLKEHVSSIRPRFQAGENYHEGFVSFASRLVDCSPSVIPKLVSYLNPVLSSIYYPQRVMATAVLSELIGRQCGGDMSLVDMLTNCLLGRLIDSDLTVRMLCIRGLGNIAKSGKEQVRKHCTTVLSAMMAGMDDKEDNEDMITLEAMSGLSKILTQVSDKDIQAILINVALRIRPCFEKEKPEVRVAAFELFGNLTAFGAGSCKEQFLEQIHTNFVTLLLHLNDSENQVKQACKRALRQVGPLIGSDAINTMFQKHLLDGAVLHYGEFINDLSKVVVRDFSTMVNNYVMASIVFFKSQWSEIRSSASILVGFLVGSMSAEQCSNISTQQICSALVMLLKDPEPDVRIRAAEAISHLSNI